MGPVFSYNCVGCGEAQLGLSHCLYKCPSNIGCGTFDCGQDVLMHESDPTILREMARIIQDADLSPNAVARGMDEAYDDLAGQLLHKAYIRRMEGDPVPLSVRMAEQFGNQPDTHSYDPPPVVAMTFKECLITREDGKDITEEEAETLMDAFVELLEERGYEIFSVTDLEKIQP